jgi:hypothetical protein
VPTIFSNKVDIERPGGPEVRSSTPRAVHSSRIHSQELTVNKVLRGISGGPCFPFAGRSLPLIPGRRYSFMQKLLGIFENLQPIRRQVFASAINIERQHAHTRRRSVGRYLLGRQFAGDCLRILVEQSRTRVGRIRVHRCRPLTSSARVAVRAALAGIFFEPCAPHISRGAVQSSKE